MNATQQRSSQRPATAVEIAAYRAAVAPHRGKAAEVEAVRRAHRMFVKWGGKEPAYFVKSH